MIELIEEIIVKFGPRPAGSNAERNAQMLMVEKCRQLTDDVKLLDFEAYLNARFGKLKYYCALFFIAVAMYFFEVHIAFLLAALSAIAFILDFMAYRTVLGSFPGPKMKSCNVEATLEPRGEVKQTLLFSGHIDSVYEFKWWYKFGQRGAHLTVLAGLLMVLLPVYLLLVILFPEGSWHLYGMLVFIVLSPSLTVYFNMHGDNPVDGASDNLSGITIAYHVFSSFAHPNEKGKSTLENTRLKFVSFGSEETGLTGSMSFAEAHRERLKADNAHIINIDGIRLPEEVRIVERELMSGTTHSKDLVQGIVAAFDAQGIPLKKGAIPIGGTDAVPFTRAGFHAVTIIGQSTDKLDHTYHTRRDIADNVNPEALENVKNGLIQFVRTKDSR